jgi:hypothetical protein
VQRCNPTRSEGDGSEQIATRHRDARIVSSMTAPDPASFVIGVMLAAVLSAAVFAHASKRGSAHPTAWGVVVFLFAGIAVPVYFIRFWLQRRNSD